ncbi:hypothetical protein [Alloactinosynnema sp. L-07]|uniref:hypothetical protein n=1 Tax=Alloactinosynnema sp. L-07 TaxID=1653480 RepID=UPI00065EF07A|nr:hypothetical protein [Alloactinosynnema sp. L-07]CRK59333.1 hypothetical protein [Alloactinosynnema sp. L-07]
MAGYKTAKANSLIESRAAIGSTPNYSESTHGHVINDFECGAGALPHDAWPAGLDPTHGGRAATLGVR